MSAADAFTRATTSALSASFSVTGPLAELTPEPSHTYPMHAIGQDLYVIREPEAQSWVPLTFYALATGERYLHFGPRATPKVG